MSPGRLLHVLGAGEWQTPTIRRARELGYRVLVTTHAPDVIDHLAAACPQTKMLLLHGTGPAMMELYEIVRCNDHLMLDLSFTMMRYKGSSRLDADMNFLLKSTDRLVTIGSDFPESTPAAVLERLAELAHGVEPHRIENITGANLERLFASWLAASA